MAEDFWRKSCSENIGEIDTWTPREDFFSLQKLIMFLMKSKV